MFTPGNNGYAGVQAGDLLGQGSSTNSAGYLFQTGVLEQTLTGYSLVPNASYTLTLDASSRGRPYSELVVDLFAGATPLTLIPGANPDLNVGSLANVPAAWSFTYVAPAVPATGDLKIRFSHTVDDLDSFDNVVLNQTPIPEPASLGLLSVAGLALLRRRRA